MGNLTHTPLPRFVGETCLFLDLELGEVWEGDLWARKQMLRLSHL